MVLHTQASTIEKRLFIVSGDLTTSTDTIPYWSLSQKAVFNQKSLVIQYNVGDTVELTIVNKHSEAHQVIVSGTAIQTKLIASGDSDLVSIPLSQPGIYKLRAKDAGGYYMGISGIIHAGKNSGKHYYWQLREHQRSINDSYEQGNGSPINKFKPEVFTLNGINHPETQTDSSTLVTGNIGDTIYIHIVNNGLMAHSIHCHGYHMTIVDSDKHPNHIGREKDSFPIEPGAYISLLLVPDKNGMYPVHDHNLIAVTGGGNYPGGMISHIKIGP